MRNATWATAVIASCTTPTRVVVRVSADDSLQPQITSVTVRGFSPPLPTTPDRVSNYTETFVPGNRWPFSTRIVPRDGDATRRFRIEVTANLTGSRSTTVRAIGGFAPGRTTEIALRFSNACLDVICGESDTCVDGSCRTAEVDAIDAGIHIDAGPADATNDATNDASSDAPRDTALDAFAPQCMRNVDCAWNRCVENVCDDPVEFALGASSACAVRALGSVVCWGAGGGGQIGDGANTPRSRPVAVALSGVLHVGVGENHACAATAAEVYCWGSNSEGQLGDGTTMNSPTPVLVSGHLSNVTALALGQSHTCAIASGNVYCWGRNNEGQTGSSGVVHVPTPVADRTGATDLAVGSRFSCSLHAGEVWCWGANNTGQLGYAGVDTRVPSRVSGVPSIMSIAAMSSTACATVGPNETWCWGFGIFGSLGDGSTTSRATPGMVSRPVTGPIGSVHFSARGDTACATTGSSVHCWGGNSSGATGVNVASDILEPTLVPSLTGVREVRTGGAFGCARMSSGGIQCWGDNNQGQLGRGSFSMAGTVNAPEPVMAP
jgi:alpha-tubulin suppressor-like RCC1 family protein